MLDAFWDAVVLSPLFEFSMQSYTFVVLLVLSTAIGLDLSRYRDAHIVDPLIGLVPTSTFVPSTRRFSYHSSQCPTFSSITLLGLGKLLTRWLGREFLD